MTTSHSLLAILQATLKCGLVDVQFSGIVVIKQRVGKLRPVTVGVHICQSSERHECVESVFTALLKSYGCACLRKPLRACVILLQDTFNRFLVDSL